MLLVASPKSATQNYLMTRSALAKAFGGNCQSDLLCRLDHQLEFRGLLDGQIAG